MDAIIEEQKPEDLDRIETLLDRAFGPDRKDKTAYRFREGVPPVPGLSLVARAGGQLVGTIRFWPAVIRTPQGERLDALLLGPIAVEPELKGKGLGRGLMRAGLDRARAQGHRLVMLVGDLDYYGRLGFDRIPEGAIDFPGWVDKARVLYLELSPGAFDGVTGRLLPVNDPAVRA